MPLGFLRRCRAIGCTVPTEPPRKFCGHHWGMLVNCERRALLDAAGTQDWVDALNEARRIILCLEHRRHPYPR